MRKLIFIFSLTIRLTPLFAQDLYQNMIVKDNNSHLFKDKSNAMIRTLDYEQPSLHIRVFKGVVNTSLLKTIVNDKVDYFFKISKIDQLKNVKAYVSYNDLLKLINAFDNLKKKSLLDLKLNTDYLDNKYSLSLDFKLGYFIQKGQIHWYFIIEDKYVLLKSVSELENSLRNAKIKMQQLKKSTL